MSSPLSCQNLPLFCQPRWTALKKIYVDTKSNVEIWHCQLKNCILYQKFEGVYRNVITTSQNRKSTCSRH